MFLPVLISIADILDSLADYLPRGGGNAGSGRFAKDNRWNACILSESDLHAHKAGTAGRTCWPTRTTQGYY